MTASMIITFAGLCLLLAMTPGPDSFLVLRFSLQSARSGVAAAAGSALGSLVWAFAVSDCSARVARSARIAPVNSPTSSSLADDKACLLTPPQHGEGRDPWPSGTRCHPIYQSAQHALKHRLVHSAPDCFHVR
jgi:hypothetical protein